MKNLPVSYSFDEKELYIHRRTLHIRELKKDCESLEKRSAQVVRDLKKHKCPDWLIPTYTTPKEFTWKNMEEKRRAWQGKYASLQRHHLELFDQLREILPPEKVPDSVLLYTEFVRERRGEQRQMKMKMAYPYPGHFHQHGVSIYCRETVRNYVESYIKRYFCRDGWVFVKRGAVKVIPLSGEFVNFRGIDRHFTHPNETSEEL